MQDYLNRFLEKATSQREEIATIKPRTFKLELSDADVQRLYEKAYCAGITPAELLEGFIGDLVCGTYDHGSDECHYAARYFDRAYPGYGSFIEWAIEHCEMDEAMEAADIICQTDDNPYDEESWREERDDATEVFQQLYDAYIATRGFCIYEPQSREDAVTAVHRYSEELYSMVQFGKYEDQGHEKPQS